MNEPVWLTVEQILVFHHRLIEEHGGLHGVRDAGLLDGAVNRPRQLHAYGEPTIFALAGAYAFGIARFHPFNDGNKRTAFASMATFLRIHGYDLVSPPDDATPMFERLAAGTVSETDLVTWIERNAQPL